MHTFAKTPARSQHSVSTSPPGPGKAAPIPAQTRQHHSTSDPHAFVSASQHSFGCIAVHGDAPQLVQLKPAPSTPGDTYEHEADAVAERVLHMSEGRHAGPCSCGGSCAKCRPHAEQPTLQLRRAQPQATESTPPPAGVQSALQQPGQPLDAPTQAFFAPRFGHDFSRVRVHTDATAARSAQAVDALAYTVGRDIVFGAGQYAPQTTSGRLLLAHELAHVVQQESSPQLVQRQKKKPGAGSNQPPAKAPGAATLPKLDLKPSTNGDACACLVFIHNNERNARLTAELMHQHCAYNLAIIAPDTGARDVVIPGKGAVDPNELFPPHIAETCLNDEKACRDDVAARSATATGAAAEEVTQKQFFLAIKDCSKSFSLPVVALHNNDITDTAEYLKQKDKVGVADLKTDIDKTKKPAEGADPVQELKDKLKKKFGESVKKSLTETSGKTNIFRWCASNDLSKCHIGDPDHPDNVIWVTNEKDFKDLSAQPVNVALQSELGKKGGESEKDLSTLFLVLKSLIGEQFAALILKLEQELQTDVRDIEQILAELEKLDQFGDRLPGDTLDAIWKILLELIEILLLWLQLLLAHVGRDIRLARLRYINIETPGKKLAEQTDAERVQHYEFVVETLKAIGLHCCGDDPTKAEAKIKAGLKTQPTK
ncbi:MAG TPA: DUF4157 domain-containing protein [Herpetosiphonaceae bacterium]